MNRNYRRSGEQRQRTAGANRQVSRQRFAKVYDNVDPGSMNNPFVEPDADQYDLHSPDNFQEDPDLRSEWRNDIAAYDEDTNFMMPLNDVPAWWGTIPKMAHRKAEACLKIAELMFPEALDSFVEAQAADLMELSPKVLTASLRRIAIYNSEPQRFEELYKTAEDGDGDGYPTLNIGEDKSLPADMDASDLESTLTEMSETETTEEMAAPAITEEAAPAISEDVIDMTADDTDEDEDYSAEDEEDEDDSFDVDAEIAAALDDAQSQINPSTELGMDFSANSDEEDMNDETTEELQDLFSTPYVDANRLSKKASVKKNKNLKLSELSKTASAHNTSASVDSLWDHGHVVSDVFGY